ncbi:MAG: hypothetical protein ABJC79_06805 [Acidimicrobiia bacterium]
MDERSAQHGPRVDDEMSLELGGLIRRVDGESEAASAATDEPASEEFRDDRHLELLGRSEIARFLRPSALPADTMTILAIAHEEHATEAVLDELARLPRGVEFATVGEIWEALGHETERRDDAAHEVMPVAEAVAEAVDDLVDAMVVEPSDVRRAPARPEQPTRVAPARPSVSADRPSRDAGPGSESARPPWWSPVRIVTLGFGVVRGAVRVADRTLATVRARILP